MKRMIPLMMGIGFLLIFLEGSAAFSQSIPEKPNSPGAAEDDIFSKSKTRKDRKLEMGDKIRIKIYPEDAFVKGADTEVSSEGKVTLPLLGKIQVEGKTVAEVEREIVDLLAQDYLVNPVVVIEIAEKSLEKHKLSLSILGQIQKPGTYDFQPDQKLTLLRVISMAGGFTDIANVKKIKVIRKAEGKTKVIHANAGSIISGKDPDIELEPGDVIHVGESFF